MDSVLVPFFVLFTIYTKRVPAVTTTLIDGMTSVDVQPWQTQIGQILVKMCASEIDRNRTTAAMVKLDQLSNAEERLKDVIEFFVQHYEDNLANLLHFIGRVPTTELQQEGSKVLANLIDSNRMAMVSLRISFIRSLSSVLKRI